jgi:hypothetical protein
LSATGAELSNCPTTFDPYLFGLVSIALAIACLRGCKYFRTER